MAVETASKTEETPVPKTTSTYTARDKRGLAYYSPYTPYAYNLPYAYSAPYTYTAPYAYPHYRYPHYYNYPHYYY